MRVCYVSMERIKISGKRISRTRVNQLMDTNLFPLSLLHYFHYWHQFFHFILLYFFLQPRSTEIFA